MGISVEKVAPKDIVIKTFSIMGSAQAVITLIATIMHLVDVLVMVAINVPTYVQKSIMIIGGITIQLELYLLIITTINFE